MDKNFRKFIFLIGVIIFILLTVLIVIGFLYRFSTINTYNLILLILMLLTIIIILFYTVCALTIFYVYKKKKANRFFLSVAKVGIKVLLPLVIFLSGVFKYNKDIIRKFYIDFNNLVVNIDGKRYNSEDVLVLLPHCLQYSECRNKITNDINNCVRCGACTIGEIISVSCQKGIKVQVVTGGTAARNIIYKQRPKIILAVACERDLTSGIIDVGKIKVIGLLNERPNGPCFNTCVDLDKFKSILEAILKN